MHSVYINVQPYKTVNLFKAAIIAGAEDRRLVPAADFAWSAVAS